MSINQPLQLRLFLSNIKNDEYSPAHITSVFLRYRNNPKEALLHLDDVERKIIITPMINKQI